ncbi:MAG: ATP-binding protein [Bdellovibrionales bacterium]|jgi:signal transduction histidine kinase
MPKTLFTKAPLIAVLAVVLVFAIVAGAGLGLDWPLLLAAAAMVFAVAEGVALWSLRKKAALDARLLRHLKFVADRLQATLRHAPMGYCLFTPQGLLREEQAVAARFGIGKLTHLDELIGAITDSGAFLAAFSKLQTSGEPFVQDIQAVQGKRPMRLYGRRFRIGTEGPHIDGLWFYDLKADDMALPASVKDESPKSAETQSEKQVAPLAAATSSGASCATATSVVSGARAGSCLDALPFPVWGRNADLELVACNKAYARVLDSTPERVLAHQHELMPPPFKGGRTLAAAVLAKGEAMEVRDHAVMNGQRRLLQIVEQPFIKEKDDPRPIALLGFALDVTPEEEKEAELRRHLVLYHEVMEHLSAAICVYSADKRLEFYNRAYQRLWEAQEVFLDSKPTFSDVLEDLRARRRIPEQVDFQKYKKEQLALFTSLLEPREDVIYLPDETSLRVMVAPHPLGGLMYVYENVTDQLALETSYNTLMAVQRETIDNLAEGIAVFGPDGKIRLSNVALATLWDLPEDFLETEPHVADFLEQAKDLVSTTDDWETRKADLVGKALHRMPRSGRMGRTDQKIVEFLTVPLPDGSVLNSFLDVTDSAKVEQALRASNAALATADRLKSDFVANVSYQLRTPLNTITGFAEILVEQYFGALNERQMDYTTTIKTESEKLSRLINNVLDLATIEAGRMTLDLQSVVVADLLNDAKAMTAEWARQQSLEILIDCPSDLGAFEVDEQRVKQVLFNLISNAIKYTPAGGHIALAAWQQDEWVVISVLDTGVGIPEDDRDRIFGKFERANDHLRQGGAGLGLSLVKSFVELHGGRVEIFSDATDGTRISCFFPQKAPKKDEAPLLGKA